MKIKLSLLLILGVSLVACSPSNDTANSPPMYESTASDDAPQEQIKAQESVPNADLTPIPMSDSHENGRYFLMSHTTENGVENVEYIRKGNESNSYSKIQINCSNNKMKSYSADNTNALHSANMGDWYTPTPDWTDEDIFNFICK